MEQNTTTTNIYKEACYNIGDLVLFALDSRYCYLGFNTNHVNTIRQIWGVEIEMGMNMLSIIAHDDDNGKAKQHFDRALSGETFTLSEEYGDVELERNFYENTYQPLYNDTNKVIGVAIYVKDISVVKNMEHSLLQANQELKDTKSKVESSENYFKALIENTHDVVSVVNVKGETAYRSPSYERVLGHKTDTLTEPDNILEYMHPSDKERVVHGFKKLLQTENLILPLSFRYLHANRTWRHLEGTAENLLADSFVKGIVVNFRDVTERKESEKELLIAKERAEESDLLKTEFINNMSHEIRTPMNGIIGFSGFLGNTNVTPDKRKDYIKIIQKCGKQLIRIIDDILEISQLETKQLIVNECAVQLKDMFQGNFLAYDILAKEKGIELRVNQGLSDRASCIITDEAKLNKALCNLLENAFKFTSKGFVEFGYYLSRNDSSMLVLYVQDTGVGIRAEQQQAIFSRFSQEEKELSQKAGGLGLGLSIANKNVELLEGTVTLNSEKGKGSTFYITIPYQPILQGEEVLVEEVKEQEVIEPSYTILLAEDEEINFLYLETLLGCIISNCHIIHAHNGAEAVRACQTTPNIDLVFMDLKMPVLNGFEATAQIKASFPNLPIVAQSGYSSSEDKEKAMKAGCNDFLTKPLLQNTLTDVIEKYL